MSDITKFVEDFEILVARAKIKEALRLGSGQCASFDEYRKGVGVITGLEYATKLAKELLKAGSLDEDEDVPADLQGIVGARQ